MANKTWKKKETNTARARKAREAKLKLLQCSSRSNSKFQASESTMTASKMYFDQLKAQRDSGPNIVKTKEASFRGRRIVACDSILLFIMHLNKHFETCSKFKLSFSHEVLKNGGLDRTTIINCQCGHAFEISSDTGIESLPINDGVAFGCLVSPIGYSAISSFLTTLDLPCPSNGFFSKLQSNAKECIFDGMEKELLAAGAEERRLAAEAGDTIMIDGKMYYKIVVIVDGGWSKRSFGHSYNANCGIGVIIGYRTRKVLFIGTRTKTCLVCTRADNLGTAPKLHDCFKNFDKPSTAMEADSIAEGFAKSISMHGLVYFEFVGDGDSSVHSRIINIYHGIQVKKVECINHAMRNFNRRLMEISSNNVKGKNAPDIPKEERQIHGMAKNFDRLGKGIRGAIDHHHEFSAEPDRSKQLDEDIMNSPLHVFGDHSKCKPYFCPPDGVRRNEENKVPFMKNTRMWIQMMKAVSRLASLSPSLIQKKDTNCVETFMSVANKYMEGKRKHLGASYLYKLRMSCAVLSFNTCSFWLPNVYHYKYGVPPQSGWLLFQEKALRERNRIKKKAVPRKITYGFLNSKKGDEFYGSNPTKPDMDIDVMAQRIQECFESVQVDELSQKAIEEESRNQSASEAWFAHRKKRITASMAGNIYKLKPTSDNTSTLNAILRNQKSRGTAAMKYGIDSESTAILSYEMDTGLEEGFVKKVGLVVSMENGIYAASPDGLVGNDGIIEVKCPYSIRDAKPSDWPILSTASPLRIQNEASPSKIQNGTSPQILVLKKTHNHYFQIVQQLHVTERKWCDYVVWTPHGTFIQRIERNEETLATWEAMKLKLKQFWFEDLAPELADSRLERNYKEFRCPPSRLIGREKLEESRKKRQLKKNLK